MSKFMAGEIFYLTPFLLVKTPEFWKNKTRGIIHEKIAKIATHTCLD